jgi:hypothetical protein
MLLVDAVDLIQRLHYLSVEFVGISWLVENAP